MIDSYFDRCDAAARYLHITTCIDTTDPRYYRGQIYASTIACNTAKAKDRVEETIYIEHLTHVFEMDLGIRVGDQDSQFDKNGFRKDKK